MTDDATALIELRKLMAAFVVERDWQQFHTPKNLAMSLAIEAGELMEHFQWLTPDQSLRVKDDAETVAEIGEEMADVLAYLVALANGLEIDLAAAFERKMGKNRQKYPAEEYRGRY